MAVTSKKKGSRMDFSAAVQKTIDQSKKAEEKSTPEPKVEKKKVEEKKVVVKEVPVEEPAASAQPTPVAQLFQVDIKKKDPRNKRHNFALSSKAENNLKKFTKENGLSANELINQFLERLY
jgi:hypothetical protein